MKYTIPTINQQAALSLGDVDLIDCHILQWLFYFCNSAYDSIERTRDGTWVNYEYLTDEMPLLGIQRRAIGNRLADLAVKGYLQLTTNRGRRKTYIKLLPKLERLFGDAPLNNREPDHRNTSAKSQTTKMRRPDHADTSARPLKYPNQYHKDTNHKDHGDLPDNNSEQQLTRQQKTPEQLEATRQKIATLKETYLKRKST